MGEKLLDCLWLWGQDAGCHHTGEAKAWRIPGVNRLDPVQGARHLGGIPNCCRVVFNGQPAPPWDRESAHLRDFRQVVWSVVGDASSTRNDNGGDDLDEVLRQARLFPNVTGGILDDFFRPATQDARLPPGRLAEVASRLHDAGLKLWLVYYAALLDIDYSAWLHLVDVVTFWSWTSAELSCAEENFSRLEALTPGQSHYAGCYLYNYGDCRPLTAFEMERQLDLYLRLWRQRRIDGVVVCSNTVADCGLEAVAVFQDWLHQFGEKAIRS